MRLLRNRGRARTGFIRRASFSRPRISFVSRCSMPSNDPRAGLFAEEFKRCIIRGERCRGQDCGDQKRMGRDAVVPQKGNPRVRLTRNASWALAATKECGADRTARTAEQDKSNEAKND